MDSINFEGAIGAAVERAKEVVPYKTGNLSRNSGILRKVGENHFQVYIDQDEAPYAPYTIEKWISPRWNGKKNPNEGWWDTFCEVIMGELANILKGDLTIK